RIPMASNPKRMKTSLELDASTASNQYESTHYVDSLSLLEKLPSELAVQIIGYTPESVFHLRKTCRILRARVNEYTRTMWERLQHQGGAQLVNELNFATERPQSVSLDIKMTVSANNSKMFDLHLICLTTADFTTLMKRSSDGEEVVSFTLMTLLTVKV
ncbi:hypothetical protein PMAYCL1PPCAC_19850, partial [Pristionchus mayeri]